MPEPQLDQLDIIKVNNRVQTDPKYANQTNIKRIIKRMRKMRQHFYRATNPNLYISEIYI